MATNASLNGIQQRYFVSDVQTGTGGAQTIPHKLGKKPVAVIVIPQTGVTSIATGTHTASALSVTVNAGGTYVVLALSGLAR